MGEYWETLPEVEVEISIKSPFNTFVQYPFLTTQPKIFVLWSSNPSTQKKRADL